MEKGRYNLEEAYPNLETLNHISSSSVNKSLEETSYPTIPSKCSLCVTNLQEAFETLGGRNNTKFPNGFQTEGFAPDFAPNTAVYQNMDANSTALTTNINKYNSQLNTYKTADMNHDPLLYPERKTVYDVLNSDLQDNLIFENMIYMTAVVITASFIIGAIYASSSGN